MFEFKKVSAEKTENNPTQREPVKTYLAWYDDGISRVSEYRATGEFGTPNEDTVCFEKLTPPELAALPGGINIRDYKTKGAVGTPMQDAISKVCDNIKTLLLEKNAAYGNSAAEPVRVFSKVDAMEQINVRIDDKLSRISKGHEFGTEDTEMDLIGYLILKRAINKLKEGRKMREGEWDKLFGEKSCRNCSRSIDGAPAGVAAADPAGGQCYRCRRLSGWKRKKIKREVAE